MNYEKWKKKPRKENSAWVKNYDDGEKLPV